MDHTLGDELAAIPRDRVPSAVSDGQWSEPPGCQLPKQLSLELEAPVVPAAEAVRWQVVTRYRLRLVAEARVPYDRLIRCGEPESAARFLHQVVEGLDREVFGALFLNGQHHAIGHTIAYVGTLNAAPAEPRGVLVPALLANASEVILFHNHPSGEVEASRDDISITMKIVEAGNIVGVKVVDHIILGEPPRYLSMVRERPW